MSPFDGLRQPGLRPSQVVAPGVADPLDEVFTWPAHEWTGRRRVEASDEQLDEVFGVRTPQPAPTAGDGSASDPSEAPVAAHAPDRENDPSAGCGVDAPDSPTGDGVGALLSGPVQALVAAVAAVAGQVPADLPEGQALAEVSVLLGQLEQLRALVLTRVADVDRRQLHSLTDAPSTGRWLAGQHSSLTRTDVAFARRLSAFPPVASAVAHGRLSVTTASRVTAALVKARRHVDRPDGLIDGQPAQPTLRAVIVDGVLDLLCQSRGGLADSDPRVSVWHTSLTQIADSLAGELDRLTEAFLLLAEHLTPADLPGALGQLLDALLPLELDKRARDGHDDRGFRMRRKDDGSGWLITRGELDLECGELLHTVLTAELTTDPDNPTDTDGYLSARADGWRPELDDEPPAASQDGPRTLDQRRHDALKNGLRRYLDAGISGLRDKVAPHLNVTITLAALHDSPGALPAVGASGTRLPRSLVQAWYCNSTITRFVLSLGRRVLATSHSERTLKPHERRAKKLETGARCQARTCRRGAATGQRLIPHHADPWAHCHTTSHHDTVLLCEQDHHHLHTGHPLRLEDGRRLGPHGWLSG